VVSSAKKRVRFSPTIRVVLIPTIDEYLVARLADSLWWTKSQYKSFKFTAHQEVKSYMDTYSISNFRIAVSALYQPQMQSESKSESKCPVLNSFLENCYSMDVYENVSVSTIINTLPDTTLNLNIPIGSFLPIKSNDVSPTSIVAIMKK
jgi:hypothetical protein